MSDLDNSIAVIAPAISFGDPQISVGLTLFTDQPYGRYATNQGRKVATITDQSIPALLRNTADLMEHHGLESMDALAEHLRQVLTGRPGAGVRS